MRSLALLDITQSTIHYTLVHDKFFNVYINHENCEKKITPKNKG